VTETDAISEHLKSRLTRRWGNRLTTRGELILHSDTHRDQRSNSEACLQKLREILLDVSRPRKPRIATKPSRGAIERRIESKRQQSQRKSARRQSRRIDPE
jgi:ribosome-associated protein